MNSTEFQLTVECCRWAFTGERADRVRELCAAADWPRLTRVLRFHRVQGLVWNCLWSVEAEAPPEVARALSGDTEVIAATNLRAALEARELRSEFERAGVPLLFVKGLTVGALAYPKPLLKMGWDIDVLVGEGDVEKAAAELSARGYRRTIPGPTAALKRWHAGRKESVWARPDEHLYVELHTRLADNWQLIPGIGVGSPSRDVEVMPGISLPTLAEDELFAYLCVHGASSLWFRLKWITDLAAILHRVPPASLERLYERSIQLGAGRASAQALLHADDLYGTLGTNGLRRRLEGDGASRRLAAAALRQVAGRREPREPTEEHFGTARIHLTQFALKPGLGFKLSEFTRQARDAVASTVRRRGGR